MDAAARSIVGQSLALRVSHPAAPPIDTLDLVMRGRAGQRLSFGADDTPPASFALVVAAALDRGMNPEDWAALTGPSADPAIRARLIQVWAEEVWPKFLSRYRIPA